MSSILRRAIVTAVLAAALPGLSIAQSAGAALSRKIPSGTYTLVPDSNYSGGMDVSVFTVRFDGDSSMVVEQSGAMMSRAKLWYDGANVLWTDLEGELMCPGTARYKYAVAEAQVRLMPIEDACEQRSAILAQIKLVRKP